MGQKMSLARGDRVDFGDRSVSTYAWLSMNSSDQRSTRKAVALGAVMSAAWALFFFAAISVSGISEIPNWGGNHDRSLIAGLAGLVFLFGTPLYALAGGVLGRFLLREKRSLLFTYCAIPLTTILGSLAVAGGIFYIAITARTHIRDARQLDIAFVNYTSSEINGIDLYPDPQQRTVETMVSFPPYERGATPVALYTLDKVLPWTAKSTINITWTRYVPCPDNRRISPTSPCEDLVMFKAEAHLPYYSGTWNKDLIVVFLPQDKVRMEVINRAHFDGKINLPPDDVYVVQGVRQKDHD